MSTTDLDTRLTAVALRAAYHEGHRDGADESSARNARYTAEHQLQIAESALRLVANIEDDDMARRTLWIARRALGTTPLSHMSERTLNATDRVYGHGSRGVDRERLPAALELVTRDLATVRGD